MTPAPSEPIPVFIDHPLLADVSPVERRSSAGAPTTTIRAPIDHRGRVVEWDEAAERMTGLSVAVVKGSLLAGLSDAGRGTSWSTHVRRLLEERDGGAPAFEEWLWRPDGRRMYVRVSLELDAHRRWVTLRDRTVRRRRDAQGDILYAVSRAALQATDFDELVRRTLATVCQALEWEAGVYWEVDGVDGGVIRCGRGMTACGQPLEMAGTVERAFGEGLAGTAWKTGRPGATRRDLQHHPALGAIAEGEGIRTALAFPVLGRTGMLGVFEFASRAAESMTEDLGRTFEIVGTHLSQCRDRLRAEQAACESHAHKAAILSNALDGIIRVDASGLIVELNEEAERTFRAPSGAMLAQSLHALAVDGEDGVTLLEAVRAVDGANNDRQGRRLSVRMRRADGDEFPVDLAITKIPLGGPAHFICVRDLSGQERLQQALHHSQKMESLGRMASEIAHDFNNFLTVIRGQAERLARRLDDGDARLQWVCSILKVSERASALTGQLLAFGRREAGRVSVIDLNAMIESTAVLLAPQLGSAVTWKTALDPAAGPARVGDGQAQRILFNLALNARDAMPEGGLLRVETRNIDLEGDVARSLLLQPGAYVRLRVVDTGRGMDARTQSRIFEPFFTTKKLGDGTGLGLSTVYAIVRQCGGQVTVSSRVGEGTTFDVYLPRVLTDTTHESSAGPRCTQTLAGTTVLLVEDEKEIRAIIREILEERGCRVIEAPDGLVALDRCATHDGPIDLLLTDLMMPRMNGHELAEQVARLRQGIPVMFVSGHPEAELGDHALAGRHVSFLRKPFSSQELLERVTRVVGR